jgi:hypothetical protein
VTAQSGIDFVHQSGDSEEKPFPAANGSGVAALDYDLDGHVDLYFLTGTPLPVDPARAGPVNRCYRNLSEWAFRDVTRETGLGDNGFSAGVAVGDFDDDGFPDVFVNAFGPKRLFRNQGDGTFVSVSESAGVSAPAWGTGAAFLDYDGDGLLDLYVCNYALWSLETNRYCGDQARGVRIFCDPTSVEPAPHTLYHNEGDGTFRDATQAAGVAGRAGRGQGVVAADVNGDGRVDLYVTNDLHPNFLFLNAGDGTFDDVSEISGTAHDYAGSNLAGMGVDAADANHDGRLDLFVTNFEGQHNTFYENLGDVQFQEVSRSRGLAAESIPWVGWGTALADFDLDGWPDVIVANGHTDGNLREMRRESLYEQPPGLWHNRKGRFAFVGGAAAGEYFARSHVGRGLCVADLDDDGDLDVVIVHQDAPPALLRNDRLSDGDDPGAWLRLRLIGVRSNRDAIGAEIRLRLEGGAVVQQVKGGGSYESAHDRRQTLALPEGTAATETGSGPASLEIVWPSGARSKHYPLLFGMTWRIVEPKGPTD